MTLRILYTGSRRWTDRYTIARAFCEAIAVHGQHLIVPDPELGQRLQWQLITLVQGEADGGDTIAAAIANAWGMTVEGHPAREHATPLARNAHMVNLGADCCISTADRWASGSGNCARLARKDGIPTYDYGADTRLEARP